MLQAGLANLWESIWYFLKLNEKWDKSCTIKLQKQNNIFPMQDIITIN